LEQVFIIIISNANDALKQKLKRDGIDSFIPKININISKKDDNNYIISIKDNGDGIPTNIMDKIFNLHFTTKGEEGSGVGLYTAKMIIEDSLNGSIEVRNNNGAEFIIDIPVR
jgi:signal transduction histidine kinase